jgi:hypothetical protein
MIHLKTLVQEFGWIHSGIGLFGNVTFLAGSVLFLPAFEPLKTLGVWLFIAGAVLMLIGTLGDLLVKVYEVRARPACDRGDGSSEQEEGARRTRSAA